MLTILDEPEMRLHALPLSVSSYEKMGELGLIEEKTELIRGVIFEKMSKSPLHSGLVRAFLRALQAVLEPDRYFVSPEQPMRLSDSCPEPDLAVISGLEGDFMLRHPESARLVVEISISTEALDREKANLYAEAGVGEYWLVLPEKKRIERFNAPGPGGYAEHAVIPADESCESIVFSDLRIRLADWLV